MIKWSMGIWDFMGSRWQLTISSPSSSRSSRELGYLILLAGSWYADRRTPQLSKHYSPTTALLYKLVEHYSFTLHPTQLPTQYCFTIQASGIKYGFTIPPTQLPTYYCFTIQASRYHYCSPPVPNYTPTTTLQYKQYEPTTTLQYQQYLPILHFSIHTLLHYLNYQANINIFILLLLSAFQFNA